MRLMTSVLGTFQTWRDVRLESVVRTKADIGKRLSNRGEIMVGGPLSAA
jgi:hypothetical protein